MPFVWCLIINQSTKVSFCLLWFTLLSHYCHTTVTTDGCSSSTSFGKSYVDMKSSIESSIHTICGMEQSHKFDLICNSLGGLHLFNIILYISNELRWRLTYFKFLSFAKNMNYLCEPFSRSMPESLQECTVRRICEVANFDTFNTTQANTAFLFVSMLRPWSMVWGCWPMDQ